MWKTQLCAVLFLIGSGYSALAQAEAINIEGKVTASTCEVDASTVDKQVDLGTPSRWQLKTAGQGSEWRDFSLLLNQCPTGITKATVTFAGTPDDQDETAFKNAGEATNVALRLTNANHSTTYGNGSKMQTDIDTTTRKASFPLSARIISPAGNASVGSFNSVINVDFTYQ